MADKTNSPFFSSIHEFVEWSEGTHPIEKILIANNGIGATKAIRSIRKWAYETFGNDRMIKFVVMATPEDMNANAEYIRMADEVVDVPGGTNNNNYANVHLICEIASRCKVDAVMPMWGHASENPLLPISLSNLERKVAFIGPPPEPMYALGDKIGSTIIAQSAGVPTIAWNGDHLSVDYRKEGIPDSIYDKANVKTPEEALECVRRIGVPVMIKASEGGGGKGIRKVLKEEDTVALYRQVQAEIPGSPIFVMKMASSARHLEVQLLADKYGEAIALSGRDCSVQRRHQKIIEEGPPTICSPEKFKEMERAAVSLAKTVGYCNAGTVEYLYMEGSKEFAFLELNPRLQVEHPVTENILGVNLPACQVQVAMGIPLHRMADVRRLYGRHPRGKDTIDFEYAERAVAPRHCIAVRVTAENPDASFQPSGGKITDLQFRSSSDVWGYFSVNDSGTIHEFADSQFGHIFAGGRDRETARRAMIMALKEVDIRGDIRTTLEYIVKMLQSDDFITNNFNTDWLDGRLANYSKIAAIENLKYCPAPTLVASCGAGLQAYRNFMSRDASFKNMLSVGQIPTIDSLKTIVKIDLIFNNIKYSTVCTQAGPETVSVECNGESETLNIRTLADGGYLISIYNTSHLAYVNEESGGNIRMILDGNTCIFTPEYDPTKFVSPVSCKIARILVKDGSHVTNGQELVEIEVMKMYMSLRATESGIVSFLKSEGAAISPGDVIAKIELDNPDCVVRAELFKGSLFEKRSRTVTSTNTTTQTLPTEIDYELPHVALRESSSLLNKVLDGYPLSNERLTNEIKTFLKSYRDPLLPAYKVDEALSVLRGRVDNDLIQTITNLNNNYKVSISNLNTSISTGSSTSSVYTKYPAVKILRAIQSTYQALPADKRIPFNNQIANLWAAVEPFLFSIEENILSELVSFLDKYLQVETLFDNMSFTDVVAQLRKENIDNLDNVLNLCRSHVNIKSKNSFILHVTELIKSLPTVFPMGRSELPSDLPIRHELHTRKLKSKLSALARLQQSACSQVSFAANLLLMDQFSLSTENRRSNLHNAVISALNTGDDVGQGDRVEILRKFSQSSIVLRDLVIESLRNDSDYQLAVLELYIRRIYQQGHEILNMTSGTSLNTDQLDNNVWINFSFVTKQVNALLINSDTRISRSLSASDLQGLVSSGSTSYSDADIRHGIIATLGSFADFDSHFPKILAKIPDVRKNDNINAIHIIVKAEPHSSDDNMAIYLKDFLAKYKKELETKYLRRVTFFVGTTLINSSESDESLATTPIPSIFTFRCRTNWDEDRLFRHVEAPHAYHLDLPRLSNFKINLEDGIQTSSGNVHLYRAIPKEGKPIRRFFARIVTFNAEPTNNELETLMVEALDALGLALGQEEANRSTNGTVKGLISSSNHFFINVVTPDAINHPDNFEALLRKISNKYSSKLTKFAVLTIEVKLTFRLSQNSDPCTFRLVLNNPSGFVLKIDKYVEVSTDGGKTSIFRTFGKLKHANESEISTDDLPVLKGEWDGCCTKVPYPTTQKFESQRAEAQASSDTLYVYDWPTLFESATEKLWSNYSNLPIEEVRLPCPKIFTCKELVLINSTTNEILPKGWNPKIAATDPNIVLVPIEREPGLNNCGMVAWHITLCTPEYPSGREIVVICNDITYQAGSFGTREDSYFYKASVYARERGIPRIFLAANSGARIGMAQSLKSFFQIAWIDENDSSKGFKYIYLTETDYNALKQKFSSNESEFPVICSPLKISETETHYVINDIIGEEEDLGVENLMGSGLIAGETSRAYNDIFTLTMVVGRSVGIGAYLVRLGQRTIQKTRQAPIILTGYQALNKLMGRDIYTTNDQLGGPMIMFPNGVSHLLAETHFDAVLKALEWMSFVPAYKGASLPMISLSSHDSINRPVQFTPQKNSIYDPRMLLNGDPFTKQLGFFDANSFIETLSGWAKTVVVGRGRLGGIPMGAILTEIRTSEATKPADPADLTSQEKLVQQAGGVWFPDSAYKTAQALRDFNREGLPCIIFANWRGFSGGQRDMFDEVLKFGSMIVDALVEYKQPLFVYIPPFAELRGGAWVVVDSTINSDVMEFYAAENARGGVLEPTGAASIKFRQKEVIETAHRIDHVLIKLDKELKELQNQTQTEEIKLKIEKIQKDIKFREKNINGVYQQVAIHFADLHDTPGRMQAKGVIRRLVPWAESRKYFYWRLRRRLLEFDIYNKSTKTASVANTIIPTRKEFISEVEDFFKSKNCNTDEEVVAWSDSNPNFIKNYIDNKKVQISSKIIKEQFDAIFSASITAEALKESLNQLTPEQLALLKSAL